MECAARRYVAGRSPARDAVSLRKLRSRAAGVLAASSGPARFDRIGAGARMAGQHQRFSAPQFRSRIPVAAELHGVRDDTAAHRLQRTSTILLKNATAYF